MPSLEIIVNNLQELIEASLIINIGDIKALSQQKGFTNEELKISKDANVHVRLLGCYVKGDQRKFFNILDKEFSVINLSKIGKPVITSMLTEEYSGLLNFTDISEWLILILLDYLKFDVNMPIYNGSLFEFAIKNDYYELMEYLFDNNLDFINDEVGDFSNGYGSVITPNFVEWLEMYCERRDKPYLYDKFCFYIQDYEDNEDACSCKACNGDGGNDSDGDDSGEEDDSDEEDLDIDDFLHYIFKNVLESQSYESDMSEVCEMYDVMMTAYNNYNSAVSDISYNMLLSEIEKNSFSNQLKIMKELAKRPII